MLEVKNRSGMAAKNSVVVGACVVDSGYDMSLDDALELEALRFAVLCGTQDKAEGTSAFLEKRAAVFTGE